MAEKRHKLTIESNAICDGQCLHTAVNLKNLNQKLMVTEISHDAGKFVCEALYYQVLKYTQSSNKSIGSIFVHVPLLEQSNTDLILRDFHFILLYFRFKTARINRNG